MSVTRNSLLIFIASYGHKLKRKEKKRKETLVLYQCLVTEYPPWWYIFSVQQ